MEGASPVILFREGGLLAVDKPAGLPATGRDLADPHCLQSELIASLGRMVWAVHQLDAETSGVMLFTERKSLVAETARRLRHPGTRKVYLAICRGVPTFERETSTEPIGEVSSGPGRRRLGVAPDGRAARSRLRVLDRAGDAALLEVVIASGRTHQIRIHLAALGHPVLGDKLYGAAAAAGTARHALHAGRLTLGGPPRQVFRAAFPDDLCRLAREHGLDPERAMATIGAR